MKRLLIASLWCATACSTPASDTPDLENGALAPCPPSPNCVSSQAQDPTHEIAPIQLIGDPQRAWAAVVRTVEATPRTRVTAQRENYLAVEETTRWMRFVDDFELWLRPGGRVEVRSASRVGWGDLGVNRERVEALRAKLVAAGVAAPGR